MFDLQTWIRRWDRHKIDSEPILDKPLSLAERTSAGWENQTHALLFELVEALAALPSAGLTPDQITQYICLVAAARHATGRTSVPSQECPHEWRRSGVINAQSYEICDRCKSTRVVPI